MSEKMSNAPVYYALAQVKFNPITAMGDYVHKVQDILRRKGYILFEPQEITQLQFNAVLGQVPAIPHLNKETIWLIIKSDRSAGFILEPSSLTFHTTHYDTHHAFFSEILLGLQTVHKAVELSHLSRVGLRYLDAVLPANGEPVEDFLVSSLHGLWFNAELRYRLHESVFETCSGPLIEKGTLMSRVYRMKSPLGYPPDLVPHGLVPMPRFDIKEAVAHAVIDTDHYVEGKMPLNFNLLSDQLASLHEGIRQAFASTITNHAKTTWA